MIYIVRPGDTLYSIASANGVPLRNFLADNGLSVPEKLPVGAALLVVRPTRVHVVEEGDTLFSIARRYGVPLIDLWRNNLFLKGRTLIYPGDVLYLETDSSSARVPSMIGGYVYPYTDSGLLDATMPFLSAVVPFTYGFRTDGSLVSPDDRTILSSAAYYGTAALMHLSTLTDNDTFSVALAEDLFASPEMQAALADSVLANLQRKNYRGLDVDFEFLGARNAQYYAAFLNLLRERLNPLGYPVLAALAPKTRDDQPGTLYEGHDYAAVGEAVNSVLLMTYEWGYTYGPPQAISPIGPVRRVLEYALTRIPANKIFLGISNYGYDFTLPYVQGLSKARSLSVEECVRLAGEKGAEIRYDETAQSPFFEYAENGIAHVVWFEDVRSLSARLSLLSEYGLRGALYWNFTRPNAQNLALVNALFLRTELNLF